MEQASLKKGLSRQPSTMMFFLRLGCDLKQVSQGLLLLSCVAFLQACNSSSDNPESPADNTPEVPATPVATEYQMSAFEGTTITIDISEEAAENFSWQQDSGPEVSRAGFHFAGILTK